jgi:integrase
MNKRRTLGAIFSRLVRKEIPFNPVKETKRVKEKATLHKAYTKEQLHRVLSILEQSHQNVYMCALFMYGCFLRPHQEVRRLFRRDLNEDCTSISLSGDDNKSGRIRTVYVPPYVHEPITRYKLDQLDQHANLFTGTCDVYNESYFNTAWSRLKEKMVKDRIIEDNHTLYSFRHTAAVNLYMKTKDLYKVQQAMGHSSMTVTLTYMRSLGLVNNITPDDVPDL